MNGQAFVKSFSHGQITIPKSFREKLGLEENFWLRMMLDKKRLIVEPIVGEVNKKNLAAKLSKVKGDWFSFSDWKKTRDEVEKRLSQQ